MFANIRNEEIIDFNCNYLDEDIIKVETSEDMYNAWRENRTKVTYQDGEIILNPDYEQEQLEIAKEEKLKENETIREQFLISGVKYKDVLWDSDIEQKLNISIQVSQMSDEDTIDWVGMDGITSLECTKEDLLNIGALLTQMTAYVWQYKNPAIKTAINNAETIEEVKAIEIVYDLGEINNTNIETIDEDISNNQ